MPETSPKNDADDSVELTEATDAKSNDVEDAAEDAATDEDTVGATAVEADVDEPADDAEADADDADDTADDADDAAENHDDAAENDDDADADEKGAGVGSKRKKTMDAKARRKAERKRIERSKEIAREATSKKSKASRRSKKKSSDDASLTKEQLRASGSKTVAEDANPVWFKPIMFGFLIIGFLWIIVYYLSQGRLPVASLADWNILVGFGIALVGFLMMSNWK